MCDAMYQLVVVFEYSRVLQLLIGLKMEVNLEIVEILMVPLPSCWVELRKSECTNNSSESQSVATIMVSAGC